MEDTCNKPDIWNKSYFDWCWSCLNMGMKMYVSDDWTQLNPEAYKFSLDLILKMREVDQSSYNYFSRQKDHYRMVLPGVEQNPYVEYLIPGFTFLIKDHVNYYTYIVKWAFEDNNLIFYFDLSGKIQP